MLFPKCRCLLGWLWLGLYNPKVSQVRNTPARVDACRFPGGDALDLHDRVAVRVADAPCAMSPKVEGGHGGYGKI